MGRKSVTSESECCDVCWNNYVILTRFILHNNHYDTPLIYALIYGRAVAARQNEASKPPLATVPKSKPAASSTSADSSVIAKRKLSGARREKDKLKGVIVKKKANNAKDKNDTKQRSAFSDTSQLKGQSEEPEAKRRRTGGIEQQVS